MTVSISKSSIKVIIFLTFYRFIWFLCVPLVLCFLVYRSRHEPAYAEKLLERFGIGRTQKGSWVWIHAVSLGEFRSAIPLSVERSFIPMQWTISNQKF
ncbi:MAG: hypothetical protein EBW86_08020 [Rhodobacteraceae bacterium]|nr:hypothetical protein [Paracoccaceae bacterium]